MTSCGFLTHIQRDNPRTNLGHLSCKLSITPFFCDDTFRVEFLLSADRLPASILSRVQSRPSSSLPDTSIHSPKLINSRPSLVSPLIKKKIQLKKKAAPATPSAGLTLATTLATSTSPSTPTLASRPIDLKKKKLTSTTLASGTTSRTDILRKSSSDKTGATAKGLNGSVKSSLSQRMILKKPLSTGVSKSPTGVATASSKLPTIAKVQGNPVVVKKRLGGPISVPSKDVKSEPSGSSILRRKANVTETKPFSATTTGRSTEKASNAFELPFQSVCLVASLHQLAKTGSRLPFGVSHWLKDLTTCIARCES